MTSRLSLLFLSFIALSACDSMLKPVTGSACENDSCGPGFLCRLEDDTCQPENDCGEGYVACADLGICIEESIGCDDEPADAGTTGVDGGVEFKADASTSGGADAGLSHDAGAACPDGGLCVEGWAWENPTPRGEYPLAAVATDDGELYFATNERSVFHVLASREDRLPTLPSVNECCTSIAGSSATNLWAAGDGTNHWDGSKWTALQNPNGDFFYSLWTGGGDVYAAKGSDLLVFKLTPGANMQWMQWATVGAASGDVITAVAGVHGTSGDTVWVGTKKGAIFKKAPADPAFVLQNDLTSEIASIRSVPGTSQLWIASRSGKAAHVDDTGGLTLEDTAQQSLVAIVTSGGDTFAVAEYAISLRMSATSWVSSATPVAQIGAAAGGPKGAIAVGYDDRFGASLERKLPNAGWASSAGSAATTQDLVTGVALPGGEAWAAGSSGAVLHRVGGVWVEEDEGVPSNNMRAMWASAPNDVWAVGDGILAHWTGSAWSLPAMPTGISSIESISGLGSKDVWAAAGAKGLLHYDGSSWQVDTSCPTMVCGGTLRSVAADPTTNELWVGGNGGLLVHRTSAGTWSKVNFQAGDDVETLYASGTTLWLGGYGALLHRTSATAFARIDEGPLGTNALFGVGDDVYAAVGSTLQHLTPSGGHPVVPLPTGGELYSGFMNNSGNVRDLYLVGGRGMILHRHEE